jgi:biotin carboxyl carrier protein
VRYRNQGKGRLRFEVDGNEHMASSVSYDDSVLSYEDGHGHRRRFRVLRDGDRRFVHSVDGSFVFTEMPRFPDPEHAEVKGGCIAPMPGKVVKVMVEEGQQVAAGDAIAILEAMKMEHTARAPEDGVVSQILVSEGEQVDAGALMAVISPAD